MRCGRRSRCCVRQAAMRSSPGCRRARYDELRRLAVAAEASHAWVALFRPPEAAHDASPAGAAHRSWNLLRMQLSLRILKRRGAPAAAPLVLAGEKAGPCSGSHCVSRSCRRPRSRRSAPGRASSRLRFRSSRRRRCCWRCEGSLRLFRRPAKLCKQRSAMPDSRRWASTRRSPPPRRRARRSGSHARRLRAHRRRRPRSGMSR